MREKAFFRYLPIMVLGIFAVISVAKGIQNALVFSQDFQWSPTVLFLEGINPYQYFLNGNIDNRIILSQAPNYAHLAYFICAPFAIMDWWYAKLIWALTNILLAIVCVNIISKEVELTKRDILIVLFVFLASASLRNTISNGQHSLVVLLAFCAFFLRPLGLRLFLMGFAYFKYSFMPVLSVFILFKHGIKGFFISCISCMLGWLAFSIVLSEPPLTALLEPLKVGSSSVGLGTADLMSFSEVFGFTKNSAPYLMFTYGIPAVVSVLIAYVIAKKETVCRLQTLSLLCIGSLMTVKHLPYDFVVLLPAFVLAYQNKKTLQGKIALGLILFFWFGIKYEFQLSELINVKIEYFIGLNFCGLLMLFIYFLKQASSVQKAIKYPNSETHYSTS
ncbi:glycosyltransferase family 87 protein [Polynucleobacter asymbioticus]|uniref:DUF2029 domain-containing protein n=1 Tax=Polynucleobacter asymbioticus (strain DSM 18221 / CIP 109841 / QLW-P1DMWA-1) TaxID=312153 RepID=A4SVN8_POLAQ|nr:glycosyltransferase family 87 protein [Polynucleobacter asymbioticus]ABP33552.1 hypothetical protein Pnuc_0331 [Polynucleobacter asymbioticus QLW-P1DMWA-1]